jgi:hypothetical protein
MSFAGSASAAMWPPPAQHAPPVVTLTPGQAHAAVRSCMAQDTRTKIAHWLAPVACEQPPRSQLLLTTILGS